eukprot:CAMPEP_0185847012 /NCGR_PEP_ID=MMETSP1354-20130828/2442_1 /TAXON_ID=708628 /ORGANISM="Erythrolobus madagascarensis, Strain CCMP3276" /LENGTH=242 /DNA_ID=CAMNT_0028547251 /DNA_START=158 /DNA_END=886 /DNA_ORIENTATION=-
MEWFEWKDAPLSSVYAPIVAIAVYLSVIFGLRRVMQDRAALKMKRVTLAHNIFLCALSVAMCVGTLFELALRVRGNGFFCIVCDLEKTAMRGRLAVWMYIFYASKYYELFDTVIMVLKKRPLNFLHVYHHCVVMPLFWVYMQTDMVLHWIIVVANSLVHVFMYYYYAAATLGFKVWWKRYITMMQIVQFVMILTATWPFPFFYYAPHGCTGSMRAWVFGQLVGFSFFKLFSDFYRRSYNKRQ